MKRRRWRIDWDVFLTAILLILCFICTLAYALFGPREPWPGISIFYILDILALGLYALARDRNGQ